MKTLKTIFAIFGLLVLVAFISWFVTTAKFSSASAPSGLKATVATTTKYVVGTTASKPFATSTCSARIITTVEKPIMIMFTDKKGESPTAVLGHYQAASTTIAYDSGIYGCDAWRIYGHDANSTITLTETQ
jgi:hypothetical protein